MDHTNTIERPLKRLRLGTRSCAECRRRKVRCIFAPDKKICNECNLHAAECIPQGVRKLSAPGSPQEDKDVREKLANLEDMVRRIWSTMDFQSESPTPSQIEFNTAEVLRRITMQTNSTRNGSDHGSTSGGVTEPTTPSNSGTSSSPRTANDQFADAPLLNLFRDAMLIQDVEIKSSATKLPYDHRLGSCVKTLQSLLPRPDDLNTILAATQPFWRIWTDAQGLSFGFDQDGPQPVRSAYGFIQKSLHSRQPAVVAKAALFVALCLQQLSTRVTNELLSPTARTRMSLEPYIILVDMLLSIGETSMPTLEGLESLEILSKLYMNMGKPRESWLSLRRGINLALLLRLPHADETSPMRGRKIWAHLWQCDRQLSMLLGLPAATTDFHPGVQTVIPDSIGDSVYHQMSVISGHVSERNQNSASTDYYRTLQIDQELRACIQGIPSEFWNAQASENTPGEMVYGLQALKIQLYMVQKNLHQPYMLQSFANREYEPSNATACDASREMIYAYQILREHPQVGLVFCDLLDFQVFTAAVVLIINLLWSPGPRNYRRDADWKLIQSVTDILKKVSESMSCAVACQAAQILEYLTAAHSGTYTGPQQFEAVIPYFGQVKINRFFPPRNALATGHPDPLPYGIDNSIQNYSPSTIDFATNTFEVLNWDNQDFVTGAELGSDWSRINNESVDYDWIQHFDCSQMGQQMGSPLNPAMTTSMFGDAGSFLVV